LGVSGNSTALAHNNAILAGGWRSEVRTYDDGDDDGDDDSTEMEGWC